MWTSKLGNSYPKADVEGRHEQTLRTLTALRRSGANARCVDCDATGTVWSSVNLGVFLCMHCGSRHRALGTHISKPKGCTGTYLWGPDELERMECVGNAQAHEIYGGLEQRPRDDAPEREWIDFLTQKYVERSFAPADETTDARFCDRDNKGTVDLIDLSADPFVLSSPPSTVYDQFRREGTIDTIGSDATSTADFFARFGV